MNLFKNTQLRASWLECLEFLGDHALLTYRDWLTAELEITPDPTND